ncbi:MAG: phosphopantothenoylcysteine decarboxylase [Verrucomicrobia bacterium]|nr:phosphopantothenoylcysteine decarboxylase [Verrucomicrobiota bacterium]MCF7707657.1 phosphopantothenoylcysteine decarboxylase [Verrucomicrobiota bacterium]
MDTTNVILGITGSIAAHKAVDLASMLSKSGCDVYAILTPDARRFITHHALATLTGHRVGMDMFGDSPELQPEHINLADIADILLIAPATANTIAKLAAGLADNLLTCTALALNPDAKILIAPAMNGKMWLNPATKQNVATLSERGVEFVGPDEGMLSCGYEGIGRLWPVDKIAERVLEISRG